jgi:hypothetical protein
MTRGIIGPRGGTLALDGHSLVVPPGAVRRHVQFTLSARPAKEVMIDISADGRSHFAFTRPVVITISYARCSGQPLQSSNLRAWYVDGSNGRLLREMRGQADEKAHTITFPVRHLSTYAVAY